MPRKKREVKLFTLDTETIGLGGDIRRIAIYDGEKVTYGFSFPDVEGELIRAYNEGYSVHVYIHNLEFDARKMPEIFRKSNVNWNNTRIINGRYVTVACKYYTFHDSWRLLPNSLKDLSHDFDVEHGKLDLWDAVQKNYPQQYKDHVDFLARCDVNNPLYLEYLGYDVMSLYEVIETLMDVTGLSKGELVTKLTTASLSKYLFRKGYKGKSFITPGQKKTDFELITCFKLWNSQKFFSNGKDGIFLEKFVRKSYMGGRVEVFTPYLQRMIVAHAFHYDVNSLYPSVMIDNEFPIGDPAYYDGIEAQIIWDNWLSDKKGLGFVHAKVFVPKQNIPPLPTHNGKLVFLTGYLEGTWTYTELEYAVNCCGVKILEIIDIVHFKKTFKVFHNFISTFYRMKDEGKRTGNKALTKLAKLILNTAYGFLALIREREDVRNISDLEKYEDVLNYVNEELGYINIDTVVVSDTVQPQIASYVTSYARLVLLDGLRTQDKKGKVFYCDTDSIVCSAPMPKEKVDKYQLGKWDLEGELKGAFFLLPKVYYEITTENENVKFKGVSRDVQKTFHYDFYKNLYERFCSGDGGKILVEQDKEMLRSISYMQKTRQDLNKIEHRSKELNLDNNHKRKIDFKGNTSEPWHMESLEQFLQFDLSRKILEYKKYGNLINTCI